MQLYGTLKLWIIDWYTSWALQNLMTTNLTQTSNFRFIDNLKKHGWASKQDGLVLTTLRYLVEDSSPREFLYCMLSLGKTSKPETWKAHLLFCYTDGINVWGGQFLAVNHHIHKNWVPSILPHNLWLVFMGIKQKKTGLQLKIAF